MCACVSECEYVSERGRGGKGGMKVDRREKNRLGDEINDPYDSVK